MTIPVTADLWTEADPWADVELDRAWATLDAEAKHERILCAAWRVFSADGLDAPKPAVAAMAGASVGSLYRQFPSKHDLLAALVTRRLEQIHEATVEASQTPGSRWEALTGMLWSIVERQHGDQILGEAWNLVLDHEDVDRAGAITRGALDDLIDAARREGRLRADAETFDIRLVFSATRAANRLAPDAWKRMLELLIDGLAARPAE